MSLLQLWAGTHDLVPEWIGWQQIAGGVGVVLAIYALQWAFAAFQVVKHLRGKPGLISFLPPFGMSVPVLLGPSSLRGNLQNPTIWRLKADVYKRFNSTVVVIPSLFPPKLTYLLSDPEAFDRVNTDKVNFEKTTLFNHPLVYMFGDNLANTDGEDWRRQRKIVASSFTDRNNAAVWEETTQVVANNLYSKIDSSADANGVSIVTQLEDIVATVTLMVVGKAGFGIQVLWPEADKSNVPFDHAMRTVLRDFPAKLFLPNWAWKLPSSYLARVDKGYKEFYNSLLNIIADRRAGVTEVSGTHGDRKDLLAHLIDANEAENGKAKLSDEELISNCFIFLLAGHETTSNSISGTLFYLAHHPEYQEQIFQEASAVFGTAPITETSFEANSSLRFTFACYQEGVRLFSPGPVVVKKCVKDTYIPSRTVPADGSAGEPFQMFVPKGAIMRENIQGLHYLPEFWPDPFKYSPSRFMKGEWNTKASEATALLATIVLRYHIEIPAHLKEDWKIRPGETEDQRRTRILKPDILSGMRPDKLQLAFRRR
ncbi:hypothetical protein MNV49_002011 [Pseudohyphozyma bogoriensis]|nr:hypothetical protein MNV49_002011 [Pseudohyphozyma bogoriensis]